MQIGILVTVLHDVCLQVMDNGLLCSQAVKTLNPILEAEATAPNAPGALQYLHTVGKDMLEKPSTWIVVSSRLGWDLPSCMPVSKQRSTSLG